MTLRSAASEVLYLFKRFFMLQFGKRRYNNEGAYAILESPDFASPSFHSFKSAERPMVMSTYLLNIQCLNDIFSFLLYGIKCKLGVTYSGQKMRFVFIQVWKQSNQFGKL